MTLAGVLLGLIDIAIMVALLLLIGVIIDWLLTKIGFSLPEQAKNIYLAIVVLIALAMAVGLIFGVAPPIKILAMSLNDAPAWHAMESAPKDGTEVRINLVFPTGVPAYWDAELERWVLSRPLHIESIHLPRGWLPK